MAAIELHLNAIHYVPNPALKSVYKKKQSVMGGKFSFSYRKVFGQYLMNMKMAYKFAELFHYYYSNLLSYLNCRIPKCPKL